MERTRIIRAAFAVAFVFTVLAFGTLPLSWMVVVPVDVRSALALAGLAFLIVALALASRELLRRSTRSLNVGRQSARRIDDLELRIETNRNELSATLEAFQHSLLRSSTSLEALLATTLEAVDDRAASTNNHLRRVEQQQTDSFKRVEQQQTDSFKRVEQQQTDSFKRIEQQLAGETKATLQRIQREQGASYRQIEALVSMLLTLDLSVPMPPMRHTWAIAPDSASLLVRTVHEYRPQVVVELGSGLSTVLVASALAQIGSGILISVEHSEKYAEETRRLLRAHGLEAVTELVIAPLTEIELDDSEWRWYDATCIPNPGKIEMLIVDGPPGATGPFARYPAVPMLQDRFRDGTIVFLDDTNRADEQEAVRRWTSEFPMEVLDTPNTEKGVALLEWTRSIE